MVLNANNRGVCEVHHKAETADHLDYRYESLPERE